jgi:arginine-tRNA-protein transferase
MIYSFYDPGHERSGLGNYINLDHILRAARTGLPYVYLGYWVEGSARMQYKVRYRPLERLSPEGWERFPAAEQDALIAAAVGGRDKGFMLVEGGKDGTPGGQDQYRLADDQEGSLQFPVAVEE